MPSGDSHLTVYKLNFWVLPMKIKTTIAFESLRDAEGKGGMYFVIIYAQKDDSLIFRRRKDRLKGEDAVCG